MLCHIPPLGALRGCAHPCITLEGSMGVPSIPLWMHGPLWPQMCYIQANSQGFHFSPSPFPPSPSSFSFSFIPSFSLFFLFSTPTHRCTSP